MSAATVGSKNLLTLGEVARRAGLSMTSALRYKKLYQDRIPSEGTGRRQRFPASAVQVFRGLKAERTASRPSAERKTERKKAPRRTVKAETGSALLTLSSISRTTGISVQTLNRYVKLYGDRIPHEGVGRKRRYHPDAIPVFRELRAQSKPGRKPKAAPAVPGKRSVPRRTVPGRGKVQAVAEQQAAPSRLLTLTAIGEQTGISGPTLQRYLKLYGDQIPFEGEGRTRRYHPEAVSVFREIRSRSSQSRKSKTRAAATAKAPQRKRRAASASASASAASGSVEARLSALEAQVNLVLQKLEEPFKLTLSR